MNLRLNPFRETCKKFATNKTYILTSNNDSLGQEYRGQVWRKHHGTGNNKFQKLRKKCNAYKY